MTTSTTTVPGAEGLGTAATWGGYPGYYGGSPVIRIITAPPARVAGIFLTAAESGDDGTRGSCLEAQSGLTTSANDPYPVPRRYRPIRGELLAPPVVRIHFRFNTGKGNGDRLE